MYFLHVVTQEDEERFKNDNNKLAKVWFILKQGFLSNNTFATNLQSGDSSCGACAIRAMTTL